MCNLQTTSGTQTGRPSRLTVAGREVTQRLRHCTCFSDSLRPAEARLRTLLAERVPRWPGVLWQLSIRSLEKIADRRQRRATETDGVRSSQHPLTSSRDIPPLRTLDGCESPKSEQLSVSLSSCVLPATHQLLKGAFCSRYRSSRADRAFYRTIRIHLLLPQGVLLKRRFFFFLASRL